MQLPVYIPLNKIGDYEHDQQLRPNRETLYLNSYNIADPEERQEIVEQFHRNIRDRVVSHQGKQEKIKYDIERIQPEAFPKNLLIFPPGNKNLQ